MTNETKEVATGIVLPVGEKKEEEFGSVTVQALIQLINERPDLLFDAIEKHDPGFTAKMNQQVFEFNKRSLEDRYSFAAKQANRQLTQKHCAAGIIGLGFIIHVALGHASFLTFAGIAVVYAVTQSGQGSFKKIAESLVQMVNGKKPNDD